MAFQVIEGIIQLEKGTEATWNEVSVPVPDKALAYAIDTKTVKRGDGATLYKDLPVLMDLNKDIDAQMFNSQFAEATGADAGSLISVSDDAYEYSDAKRLSTVITKAQASSALANKALNGHAHSDLYMTAGDIQEVITSAKTLSKEDSDILSYLLLEHLNETKKLSNLDSGDFGVYTNLRAINSNTTKPTICAIGEKIYAFGGEQGGGYTSQFFEYDHSTNTWTELSGGPSKRAFHTAVVINDKMYVYGGWGGSSLNDCWEFNPNGNVWTQKANGPYSRYSHAATTYNGKMYILSGYNQSASIQTDLRVYDPVANSWNQLASIPVGRVDCSFATFGDKLYAYGGYDGSDVSKTFWEYDVVADEWTQLTDGPTNLYHHTASVIDDKMYIVCGLGSSGSVNAVWVYDFAKAKWAQLAPGVMAIRGHGSTVYDDKIYSLGGYGEGELTDRFWKYDPIVTGRDIPRTFLDYNGFTDEFIDTDEVDTPVIFDTSPSEFDGTPRRTYGNAMVVIGDKIYLFGGYNNPNYFDDMWEYDVPTDTWTLKAKAPGGRRDATLTLINGKIYMIGGANDSQSIVYDDCWEYDPAADSWTQKADVPQQIRRHTAVNIGDKVYVYGGYTNGSVTSVRHLYIYDPVANTWESKLNSGPFRTYMHTAEVIGNKMYVSGGYDQDARVTNRFIVYDADEDDWSNCHDAPWAAMYQTLTNINDKLYLMGGWNNTISRGDGNIAQYDPVTDSWRMLYDNNALNYRGNLYYHSAVEYNGDIWSYHTGGLARIDLSNINTVYTQTSHENEALKSITNKWDIVSINPTARYANAVGVIDNKVYVFGGQGLDDSSLNDLWSYDLETDEWTALATGPAARSYHVSAVINGKFYIHGGYAGGFSSDLWEYDPSTDTWTQKASGGTATHQHTAVVYNSKMYIFGGDANGANNSLYEYNPATNTWATKASGASARHGHAAAVVGNKMYVHSGYNKSDDLWEYNFDTNTWTQLASGGTSNYGHCAFAINNKLYFYGGYSDPDLYVYNIALNTWENYGATPQLHRYPGAYVGNGILYICGGYVSGAASNILYSFIDFKELNITSKAIVHSESDVTSARMMIRGTDHDSMNIDSKVEISRDGGQNFALAHMEKSILTTGDNHVFVGDCAFDSKLFADTHDVTEMTLEDIKGDISMLTVDTDDTSGHFNVAPGIDLAGYVIDLGETTVTIISSDESTDANSVVFDGELPVGNHPIDRITGFAVADGKAAINTVIDGEAIMFNKRRQIMAVTIDNFAYIWGGLSVAGYHTDFYRFDMIKGTWKKLSEGPGMRIATTMAAVGTKIYMYGGWSNTAEYLGDVWEYDTTTDTWVQKADGPAGVYGHWMIEHGGKIYMYGGRDGGGNNLNQFYEYISETDTWNALADGPAGRTNPTMAAHNGKVYVFGGHTQPNTPMGEMWEYSIAGNSWTQKTSAPMALYAQAHCQYEGKLYTIGGFRTSVPTDNCYVYDMETDSWSSIASYGISIYVGTAMVYDGKIWHMGGYDNQTAENYNEVKIYDIAENAWYPAEHLVGRNSPWEIEDAYPSVRTGHIIEIIDNKLYLFGGIGDDSFLPPGLYIYNLNTKKWTLKEAPLGGRRFHSSSVIGTKLYIQGGFSTQYNNDLWSYDTVTEEWEFVSSAPMTARYYHTQVTINDKLYFYGGLGNEGVANSDTWEFDPATEIWTEKAAHPSYGLYLHADAVYNDKMYVFAGYDRTTHRNQLWSYDPSTDTWAELAAHASRRNYSDMVAYNGKLYVHGGQDDTELYTPTMLEYDIASNTWNDALMPSPFDRRSSGLVSDGNGNLYLFGGNIDGGRANDFWKFNIADAGSGNPVGRFQPTSGIIDNKLYVYGGYDNANGLNDLWCFDLTAETWEQKADGHYDAEHHAGCVVNGKLYVHGGYQRSAGLYRNDLWVYDPATDTWEQKAGSQELRAYHPMVNVGNKLYVFGGYRSTDVNISTAEVYDIDANSWSYIQAMPLNVYAAAAVAIGGKIYLSGGANASDAYQNKLWEYDIAGNSWTTKANAPGEWAYHEAVVYNNKMYIINPYYISIYDPSTNQWEERKDLAYADTWHSTATIDNGKLYIFGGTTTGSIYLNDLVVLDIPSGNFEKITKNPWEEINREFPMVYNQRAVTVGDKIYLLCGMYNDDAGAFVLNPNMYIYDIPTQTYVVVDCPIPLRNYHTVVEINGALYVFGGFDNGDPDTYLNDLWMYDIGTGKWAQRASAPTYYRRNHVAVAYNGKMYIHGGRTVTSPTGGSNNSSDHLYEYDPVTDVWTAKATSPTGRRQHTSALIGNKWYMFGGTYGDGSYNTSIDVYDLDANTWNTIADGFYQMRYLNCVTVGTDVYLFGGSNDVSGNQPVVWKFDTTDESWEQKTSFEFNLNYPAVTLYNDEMYVIGGATNYANTTILTYNTTTDDWSVVNEMVAPTISFAGGCVVDDYLYIVGGSEKGYLGTFTNVTWRCHLPTGVWRQMAICPVVTCYNSVVHINGKLYTFGGWDGSNVLNSLYAYDIATNTWEQKLSQVDNPVYSHTAVVIDDMMYVYGGHNNGTPNSKLTMYNPLTNTWHSKASGPNGRRTHAACVINGKMYIIGGYDNSSTISHRIDEYDPATNAWTLKRNMSQARHIPMVTVLNNKAYIFNGYDGVEHGDYCEIYDPADNSLFGLKTPIEAWFAAVCFTYNEKAYMYGGNSFGGADPANTMRSYTPYDKIIPAEPMSFETADLEKMTYAQFTGENLGISYVTYFKDNAYYILENDALVKIAELIDKWYYRDNQLLMVAAPVNSGLSAVSAAMKHTINRTLARDVRVNGTEMLPHDVSRIAVTLFPEMNANVSGVDLRGIEAATFPAGKDIRYRITSSEDIEVNGVRLHWNN